MGQRGGRTVEFLVEVVTPPADGLGQHKARGQRVAELEQVDVVSAAADPRADGAERDRIPDTLAAVPDVERLDRIMS